MTLPDHPGNEPGWWGNKYAGKRQCTTLLTDGSRRCRRECLKGQLICYKHGGMAPANRNKGLAVWGEHQVEQQVEKLIEKHGIRRLSLGDVYDELEVAGGEIASFKDYCQALVAKLDSPRYQSQGGTEQLRAEVGLWERSIERHVKLLIEIAKLGISEKRIQISKVQAARAVDTTKAILAEVFGMLRSGATVDEAEAAWPDIAWRYLDGPA